ncbi:MAG: BBP7 family outer membrane beta-barrel protein [Planctomycetota bacterium]|nr:BBP7 family outer membrane beta-barrel protein [Planctomycetota bacterium]
MKHLLFFVLFTCSISAFSQDIVQQEAPKPRLARSLFPQSGSTDQSPVNLKPEIILQEASGIVQASEGEADTTLDISPLESATEVDPSPESTGAGVTEYAGPPRLRDINLDLFERRLKLFNGFRDWNDDQIGRWVRLDYLIAWRRGTRIPALVTTSTAGTALEDAGVLGLPNTSSLLASNELHTAAQPGVRIDFGRWIAGTETAIGARFYGLSDAGSRLTFNNDIVTRPFFNVDASEQQSLPVNYPGSESGTLTLDSATEMLGTDVYVLRPWRESGTARVNFLAGYQFSRFNESISIHSLSSNLDGRNGIPIGTQLEVRDTFRTRNEFHGGLIGLASEIDGGTYTLSLLAKVGIGGVNHRITASGATTITDPSGGTSTSDGLLVTQSNQGTVERNRFTMIPEFSARYTHHINATLDFSVGYSLIYWAHAVQPGNQIDLNVDMTNTTGQPAMPFTIDHYWAQSLNMGITVRY